MKKLIRLLFLALVVSMFSACGGGSDGDSKPEINVDADFAPFNIAGCEFKSREAIADSFFLLGLRINFDVLDEQYANYIGAECNGNVKAALDAYGVSLNDFVGPLTHRVDEGQDITAWSHYPLDWGYAEMRSNLYFVLWGIVRD